MTVYQKAFEQAMRIFEITKGFSKSEQYSLTDQIRRSSRSVCTNIAEAWSKRRYPAHFISKLTDTDAEAAETKTWLDFSLHCKYIEELRYQQFMGDYDEIGKMLGSMISSPEKFCHTKQNK